MTVRIDAFAATVDESMEVREGSWDGARGEREAFAWATRDDDTVDWEKAAQCFGVADLNPPAGENITRASFKLCVTYIEDDKPIAIGNALRNALRNALARLPQTEDLSDAVRAEVKGRFERMLDRLRSDHERADQIAEPDEATAKAWVVEHLLDARKMPRTRMAALKSIEDRYAWLKPPSVDMVFRGLRNLTKRAADHRDGLLHPSDPVRDKSWTTSRKVADEYALAEHTIEDREAGRVGAVLQARASADVLLLNADELAKVTGIGDVPHPDDGKPLRDMIIAEQEVVALDSLDVIDVHVLPYVDRGDVSGHPEIVDSVDRLFAAMHRLGGVGASRALQLWIDGDGPHWIDVNETDDLEFDMGAFERETENDVVNVRKAVTFIADADHERAIADMAASGRVLRWSRVDCTVDGKTIDAIDRAIDVARRLAPRGDPGSIRAIADELRTDGLDDYLTPDGFLRIKVKASRTGSQLYSDGITSWWEFRSADEVGSQETLDSWGLKPLTDDHPPVMVTPATYTKYARGSCGQDAVLLEQTDADGERYTELTVLVGDLAMLEKIRKGIEEEAAGTPDAERVGKLELSAGYTMIPKARAGVDPVSGVKTTYDQTKIRINHLALVDRGRAGPLARFSVDGAAYEIKTKDTPMTTKKRDMMDPEAAKMLILNVVGYLKPETPEMGAEALSKAAEMTGLEPEAITTMLAPLMAEAEPPGESMDKIEVAPGIVMLADADAKARWSARELEAKDAKATVAKLTEDVADLRGKLAGSQRKVDMLTTAHEEKIRDALQAEIKALCPKLSASWDAMKAERKWFTVDAEGAKQFAMSPTEMKVAAIIDLDPRMARKIEEGRGEGFDSFVNALYGTVTEQPARASNDAAGETPANVVDFAALNKAIAASTYGKK